VFIRGSLLSSAPSAESGGGSTTNVKVVNNESSPPTGKEAPPTDTKESDKTMTPTSDNLQERMPKDGDEVAVLETGSGKIVILLYPDQAPKTVDNFKKLNDTYGHDAGDQALKHLAQVVREALRPQDTLARYGGEEFVIVLSDTHLDDGVHAMVRVQRELTRKFFLHRNEKLLITFSCGVAELAGDEDPAAALKRADEAMYLAKRAGKNRVVAA